MTDAHLAPQPLGSPLPTLGDCLAWLEPRLVAAHMGRFDDTESDDMPWWPAGFARGRDERVFEIAVGAVLTQNTNWRNVERALVNLDEAGALAPEAIAALADEDLVELIRPSGFYRVKTRRLRAFTEAWLSAGGYSELRERDTPGLRRWLLDIHGIGRETADDILLYGFCRPVWVIDSYTRRLVARLGFPALAEAAYDDLAETLLADTPEPTAPRLARWHGLIVEHAKAHCRVRPGCEACPLSDGCDYALSKSGQAV